MKLLRSLFVLGAAATLWTGAAQAQAWDSSGNGQLNGTYYFRQVYYFLGDATGALQGAASLYGNITFDGAGHYSLANATLLLSGSAPQAYPLSGTYSIAASGYGFLSGLYCPFSAGCGSNNVYVLVSKGVLVGSSTESNINDVMVAAPVPSPLPTNASFQGNWNMAAYIPAGTPTSALDALFQMNPDGNGNLSTVNVNGYVGGSTSTVTQNATGVKYVFNNGAAVLTFPTTSTSYFFAGNEYLYFSPDGTFCFGGSPNGYDLIVGVRNPGSGTTQTLSGTYYTAGIDQDTSTYSSYGYADFLTYYGSFNTAVVNGTGTILAADRLQDLFNNNTLDSTYSYTFPTSISSGTYTTSGISQYAVSANGAVRIGAGVGPYLGLSIALQGPALSGSGVYLNPTGIVSAASSSPFTAGISPGEAITLYGSGLASGFTAATTVPYPSSLGGVVVKINGQAAPIIYVSPGQISVLVPYATTSAIAQIQVLNGTASSNVVTTYVNKTSPSVFTQTANGVGYAVALHADFTLITPSHPAAPGETIVAYVSGLGSLLTPVQDGAIPPSTTLAYTSNTINAYVGGVLANLNGQTTTQGTFAVLAPGLAGVYQVNLTVPSSTAAGDQILELDGPDAQAAQAHITVSAGATAAAASTPAKLQGRGNTIKSAPRLRKSSGSLR